MIDMIYILIAGFFVNLIFTYGGNTSLNKDWFIKMGLFLISLSFFHLSFLNDTDNVLHMSLNDVHNMADYCKATHVEHCTIDLDMKAQ